MKIDFFDFYVRPWFGHFFFQKSQFSGFLPKCLLFWGSKYPKKKLIGLKFCSKSAKNYTLFFLIILWKIFFAKKLKNFAKKFSEILKKKIVGKIVAKISEDPKNMVSRPGSEGSDHGLGRWPQWVMWEDLKRY